MNHDKETMIGVEEHYKEALNYFSTNRIVGIFLQGSQNYKLETSISDVDTKLIVVPTFEDIAFNKKPVSTTHIRENDEHIDFKDIRLYIETFRKQNLNFIEILFTDYLKLNPLYADLWNILVHYREEIAHYHWDRALKSMYGVACEKRHALQHPYPSKLKILEKYGYDAKQLHHLIRINRFIENYIKYMPYKECMILPEAEREHLIAVKNFKYPVEVAIRIADDCIKNITEIVDNSLNGEKPNAQVDEMLNYVQLEIMKRAIKEEFNVYPY